MDSYCVIHFKDKQEKGKILTFLAVETEADYKVTKDLKEYVAKMFGVKFIEQFYCNEPSVVDSGNCRLNQREAIETATVAKDNTVNNIVGVVTTTIDTLPIEQQYSSAPIVPPSPIDYNVFDQQVSVVEQQNKWVETIKNEVTNDSAPISTAQPSPILDNPQNLINMEDYGTYVPYRERMVEPKEERIDDEVTVDHSVVSNLVEMDEDATDESITMSKDVPSSSRRLGRVTKRPRYSMDEDSDNEEEYIPERSIARNDASLTVRRSGKFKRQRYSIDNDKDADDMLETKRKPKTNQKSVTKNENVAFKCQKCGIARTQYRDREYHVMSHAKIMKYKCLVDRCQYATVQKTTIMRHMNTKHKDKLECFEEIELTRDQMEKLEEMRKECYSGSSNDRESKCQVCHQSIGKCRNIAFIQRQHALHHIDFMLYKCMEDRCQFECKEKRLMTTHVTKFHEGSARENFETNKLTKEQELEIEEMVMKCFPNIDTNRKEVDDSEKL